MHNKWLILFLGRNPGGVGEIRCQCEYTNIRPQTDTIVPFNVRKIQQGGVSQNTCV